jgi:carbon monoxide dehydrogenase subunit G
MFAIMSRALSRFSNTRTLGLLGAFILASGVSIAAESPIRSIDVVQDSDRYRADLVMFAPVPLNIAWDVLTDFDHMAKWVPNLRESKGTVSEPNVVLVEQQGVAKFGIFSFPYTSVRKMQLTPQKTVKATQVEGNMKQLESLMTLTPDGNGTRLNYHLEMVPAGLAATVLSKDFLQHELSDQFTAIIGEMVRRNR